jgi:hypothetical protein
MGACMLLDSAHCNLCTLEKKYNNRKHHIPGGTHGLTTQAHPTQSTYGCSTTTHCHTRQPEHYRRCRQTQYTHGARNRRTHRPVHNSAPDTAPQRHAYIHTRHIHKKRHTFQTSSTIPVTKDQSKRLQMPARTLLPAPTNSLHTRRSPSAHPPLGTTLHQTRLHGCIHTRHTHQLYQAWPHGHP